MDYAQTMRGIQSLRHHRDNARHLGHVHWPTIGHELLERATTHELHHQKRSAITHKTEIGHARHAIMIDTTGGFGFLSKARNRRRVGHALFAQHLDRDLLGQPHITRRVHRPHSSFTQQIRYHVPIAEHFANQMIANNSGT